MKNKEKGSIKLFIILCGFSIALCSCHKTSVRPADYLDQVIYMPAATSGYFEINDISRERGDLPFDGEPYRYIVDTAAREFNIPLAVYRAGVNNDGGFKVDITVNTDTITTLIATGELTNTALLPSDKYSIVSSVVMQDGKETAGFNLVVNLDSLRKDYPDSIYALGVSISSHQRETNPKLSTTIVVIDTKIMKPTAHFTYSVDGDNPSDIIFDNTSLMSTDYSWDFGDGSSSSTVDTPTHIYKTPGTYTVTLEATGITGSQDRSTMTAVIHVR